MRPGGGRHGAGRHQGERRPARPIPDPADPRGSAGLPRPAPRRNRHDDRAGEDGHREQEVRRNHQRVQAGLDRDQAERRLRERSGEDGDGEPGGPARDVAPAQAATAVAAERPIGRIATARFENSIAPW